MLDMVGECEWPRGPTAADAMFMVEAVTDCSRCTWEEGGDDAGTGEDRTADGNRPSVSRLLPSSTVS